MMELENKLLEIILCPPDVCGGVGPHSDNSCQGMTVWIVLGSNFRVSLDTLPGAVLFKNWGRNLIAVC